MTGGATQSDEYGQVPLDPACRGQRVPLGGDQEPATALPIRVVHGTFEKALGYLDDRHNLSSWTGTSGR